MLWYFAQRKLDALKKQPLTNKIAFARLSATLDELSQKDAQPLIPLRGEMRYIEHKAGENYLCADFANKILGGGVLRDGAVMEEIMMIGRPE